MLPFFCSIDRSSTQWQGIQIVRWADWMSLSDGLSSQTHWRRFVTHLCRTFSLFPHSYQDVVIDRLSWWVEWVYLMAYQAKLIEESLWRIFAKLFQCFHIHIKMWWPNEDQRELYEKGYPLDKILVEFISTFLIPISSAEWKLRRYIMLLKVIKSSNAFDG